MSFYEKYVQLCGNLKDKPDRATPYKIDYLKSIIKNGKVYKFVAFNETVINPPAELGRLTDAGGGEQSIKIENSAV